MRKYSLVAFLLSGVVSIGVEAGQPIADINAFEKRYVECAEKNFVNGCFEKIFAGRLDSDGLEGRVQSYLNEWIAGSSMYKVHVVDKFKKAGLYERRSYIFERSSGGLMGFVVSFRSVKSSWYAYDVQVNYTESFIRYLLEIPPIVPANNN